jgi:hypothetical protein
MAAKEKDIRGLLDSFLSTNHVTSIYNFWLEELPTAKSVLTEYANQSRCVVYFSVQHTVMGVHTEVYSAKAHTVLTHATTLRLLATEFDCTK